jgi:hypothetical protein
MSILDEILRDCAEDMKCTVKAKTKLLILNQEKDQLIDDIKKAISEKELVEHNEIQAEIHYFGDEALIRYYDILINLLADQLWDKLKAIISELEKEEKN